MKLYKSIEEDINNLRENNGHICKWENKGSSWMHSECTVNWKENGVMMQEEYNFFWEENGRMSHFLGCHEREMPENVYRNVTSHLSQRYWFDVRYKYLEQIMLGLLIPLPVRTSNIYVDRFLSEMVSLKKI